MKKTILATAVLLSSNQVFAQEEMNNPNFNYVEAGYVQLDIDDIDDIKPAGFTLSAAKQFNQVYVAATYLRGTDDTTETYQVTEPGYSVFENADLELTATQFELAVGYIWDVGSASTIDISAGYGNLKADADVSFTAEVSYFDDNGGVVTDVYSDSGSESDDENYYSATVRYTLNIEQLVLKAALGAERYDSASADTEIVYTAEAGYFITDDFSVNLIYTGGADYSIAGLTARYHF